MPVCFFEYKVKMSAPLIIAANSGDPNSTGTADYIPGTSIRGVLASAIQRKQRDAAQSDKLINDLVLNDKIHFLPAYVEIASGASASRGYPIPLYLRQEKYPIDEMEFIDLFAYEKKRISGKEQGTPPDGLKSLHRYFNPGIAQLQLKSIASSMRVHNRRDRVKGHATEENGDLFAYESLDEGYTFRGIIRVVDESNESAVQKIKEIAGFLDGSVNIGRSRRAGYGGNGIIRIDTEKKLEREIAVVSGDFELVNCDISKDQFFRMYCTSPYIGRNAITGHTDPNYLYTELEQKFAGRVEVCSEISVCETVGGYNRKWQSEINQAYALKAGSALLVRAKADIPFSEILEIEKNGLGVRKNEGFGCIVFFKDRDSHAIRFNKARLVVETRPEATAPKFIEELEKKLVLKALSDLIDKEVASILNSAGNTQLPPGSLIGRFRILFFNPAVAFSKLGEWLGEDDRLKLKRPARKNLEKCHLKIKNNDLSLFELLKKFKDRQDDPVFTDNFFRPLERIAISTKNISRDYFSQPELDGLRITFLRRLFKGMALKNRRNKNA